MGRFQAVSGPFPTRQFSHLLIQIIFWIQWFILTLILTTVFLFLMSFKTIRCYFAGSRLYPSTQSICTISQTIHLPGLGPICSIISHAQDAQGLCNRHKPFWSDDRVVTVNPETDMNYISSSRGAVIIPELTSPTHGRKPCSGSKSSIWACNFEKNENISSPSVILEDFLTDEEEECWEFSGNTGQIAINMTEPVVITHISIGRPRHGLPFRAPKNMSLWALVDNREISQEIITHELPLSALRLRSGSLSYVNDILRRFSFVHIASIEHDINNSSGPRQFFFLNHTQITTQTVLLQIESNFGGETTCLYWVGMYSVG